MADQGEELLRGSLRSAVDKFLERTRVVANLVKSVGSGAGRAPWPEPLARMLGSIQQIMDQTLPFTAELEVLLLELGERRLAGGAQQTQLSAFDQRLDVLENPCSDGELDTSVDPVAPAADRDSPLGRTVTGIPAD